MAQSRFFYLCELFNGNTFVAAEKKTSSTFIDWRWHKYKQSWDAKTFDISLNRISKVNSKKHHVAAHIQLTKWIQHFHTEICYRFHIICSLRGAWWWKRLPRMESHYYFIERSGKCFSFGTQQAKCIIYFQWINLLLSNCDCVLPVQKKVFDKWFWKVSNGWKVSNIYLETLSRKL